MHKTYWFIDRASFYTEKLDRAHNGNYTEKYMMPYFWCCDIRGENGLITKELPEEFRSNPVFKASKRVTLSKDKFLEVRSMIMTHPSFAGYSPNNLIRGYGFLPVDFDPPSINSDFAWCARGSHLVVSDRVHLVMQACAGKDFISINLSRDYWLVFPIFKCLPPQERRGGEVCPICGLHLNERNESNFFFENDMMIEHKIFVMGSTSRIVASNDLKEMIEALSPSNVVFKEIVKSS